MFAIKKGTKFESRCPNGHSLEFCPVCGLPVSVLELPCDTPYCDNCNNPVDPCWNYCPYCGQAREP